MDLLDRIANYFKEWDGIDETAPKMELSINDLRYIASMNVERCKLLKKINDANQKIENMKSLLEKSAEEIENLYGKDTILSEEIRNFINQLN